MKIAVLFPGQGSHYVGMGKEFYDTIRSCAEIMERAEAVCRIPLRRFCHEGPLEELTRAAVMQPAITATNLICLQALKENLPDFLRISSFAGHSLGEYSALCAAGVISLEDTMALVERRGFFMEREGRKNPGGMSAVLGLGIDAVESAVSEYSGPGVVTIANHNSAEQVVLSGTAEALAAIGEVLQDSGAKVIKLNVVLANHSPLVAGAVADFSDVLGTVTFAVPQGSLYCNATAAVEDDPDRIKDIMKKQIVSRVRWYELISRMLADGVDTFLEVGPKAVLKGMMRKIVPKDVAVTTLQLDNPAALASCLQRLKGEL
jgi:[acyl-carrier-protein] S-malonyltransferase